MSGLMPVLICFVVIVMPLWLSLHYSKEKQQIKKISSEDLDMLEELLAGLDKLEERMSTVERLVFPGEVSVAARTEVLNKNEESSDKGVA